MTTFEFDNTQTAYDSTQCRDDIKHGDVLVIGHEGVVGLLNAAWPMAVTVAHGELHGVKDGSTWAEIIESMSDNRQAQQWFRAGLAEAVRLAVAACLPLSDATTAAVADGTLSGAPEAAERALGPSGPAGY
jgi:hypothetical protein